MNFPIAQAEAFEVIQPNRLFTSPAHAHSVYGSRLVRVWRDIQSRKFCCLINTEIKTKKGQRFATWQKTKREKNGRYYLGDS